MQRRQRGNIIVAFFLMALGLWLIIGGLGVALPGVGNIWPVIPIIFGVATLTQSSGGGAREQGLVFAGVLTTLSGGLLLLFTLGALPWRDMSLYWPAFPLIVGLSFLSVYLAGGMRDAGLLVPAFATGGVGVIAFPFTLGAVQSPLLNRLAQLWPVFVVILGLAFLFRPAIRKSAKPATEMPSIIPPEELPRVITPPEEAPQMDAEPSASPPTDEPPQEDAGE